MAETNVDSKVKQPDYAAPNFDGDFRLLELSLHSPNNRDVVQLNSSSVLSFNQSRVARCSSVKFSAIQIILLAFVPAA